MERDGAGGGGEGGGWWGCEGCERDAGLQRGAVAKYPKKDPKRVPKERGCKTQAMQYPTRECNTQSGDAVSKVGRMPNSKDAVPKKRMRYPKGGCSTRGGTQYPKWRKIQYPKRDATLEGDALLPEDAIVCYVRRM